MNNYHIILVGVTYTAACESALRQAHYIARKSRAKLLAFHAVRPVEINEVVNYYAIDRDLMISSARSSLEAFVERALGPNHEVTCLVNEGKPHHEFSCLARKVRADLVVIGADHATSDLRKYGQFAIKTLRLTTIPVLIVREYPHRPFARLTACIDFSESTIPVIEHTARLDFTRDQLIEIVHVSCPHGFNSSFLRFRTKIFPSKENREQYHEILDAQLSGIRKSTSHLFQSAPITTTLEHNAPSTALIEHLKKSQSELVILGRSSKGIKGLKTDLLGSTAETLIRRTHCSILIVPTHT